MRKGGRTMGPVKPEKRMRGARRMANGNDKEFKSCSILASAQ